MSPALEAYLTCALWSSHDESDETGGKPMDENYDISDIAPESVEQAAKELDDFTAANTALIEASGMDDEQLGHDFWLTRNHHGAGFWDRGYPKGIGKALTDSAHAYGESDAYVGDDGKVYLS